MRIERWIYEVKYTLKDCPMLTRTLPDLYEEEVIAEVVSEKLKLELGDTYAVVKVVPRKLVSNEYRYGGIWA
ncbi:transposase [Bacillus phage Juglone]|uniref:Transposase n=1 Tax=Bacillus phage Juglone TaxID=1805949 RepID=A0A143FIZ0_9CAUD|nr:transposase [Bacillus phage Juglone]